jgi:ParB-like chromosome segregation protein Spo0J
MNKNIIYKEKGSFRHSDGETVSFAEEFKLIQKEVEKKKRFKKIDDLKPHPKNVEVYEKNLDDDFLKSIEEVGIINPIIITDEGCELGPNVIISGHRRYYAAKKLGIKTVPTRLMESWEKVGAGSREQNAFDEFLTAGEVERALITFNKHRIKSKYEIAREFEVLKEAEAKIAKERKIEAGKRYGEAHPKKEVAEKFPQALSKGRSRDLAAQQLGMSGRTAEKALKVTKHIDKLKGEGKDNKAEALKKKLEKSVDGAYKTISKPKRIPDYVSDPNEVLDEDGLTPTEAWHFVTIAITQLKKIRPDDPKKGEALNHVIKWIKEQLSTN